jgi:hypothetical protein
LDAYKGNPDIKNLIKDIKDDSSGVKYVYLQPLQDDTDMPVEIGQEIPKTAPERTIDSMAKSALAKRS